MLQPKEIVLFFWEKEKILFSKQNKEAIQRDKWSESLCAMETYDPSHFVPQICGPVLYIQMNL